MTIGIYGGSFDPIHIGHLTMAELFLSQYKLDKILFIPTYQSPLKENKKNISINYIIELLKSAIKYNDKFEIEDFEINKIEKSYTIDTIKYLQDKYSAKFFLLIGDDQFFQFQQWKDWSEILNLVELVVVRRTKYDYNTIITEIHKYKKWGFNINLMRAPFLEISSSYIRDCIANNIPYKFFVPDEIANIIKEKKLYQ